MRTVLVSAVALAACGMLGGCAEALVDEQVPAVARAADADTILARMSAGQSLVSGEALERELAAAASSPLGSMDNPVRTQGPSGQRSYLSRLRCSDLSVPEFGRRGNVGPGRYGNIVDVYEVTCVGSEPAMSDIYMDMYHAGHVEDRAVPGFGIAGGIVGAVSGGDAVD